MRLRYILLPLALILSAGGSIFLFAPAKYRDISRIMATARGQAEGTTKIHPPHAALQDTIYNRLRRMEIPDSAVSIQTEKSVIEIRTAIPRGEPVEIVIDQLSAALSGTAYHIEDCYCPAQGKYCALRYRSSIAGEPVVNLTMVHSARYYSKAARIIVVLTDFASARSDLAEEFLDFPAPLTFAIVPSSTSAKLAGRIAKQHDKTVITLLPMEPARNIRDEYRKTRIMIDYSDNRLRSLMQASFDKVPGSAGVMNLGGIRALEDSRVMEIIYSEMQDRHAVFIEQAAPRKSIAADLASKLKIPFAEADRYIDSSATEPQARELLGRYAIESQTRGTIIICGTATENLLNVLKRDLPDLKRNGITLSQLHDLFNAPKDEE